MTPRLITEPTLTFSEADARDAHARWGCNCGPAALAMMLGLKPDDVRSHIPDFDSKRFTNPSMMSAALMALGVDYRAITEEKPDFVDNGLVRIQWDGPWCKPGVPIGARYRHSHWIGALRHQGQLWIFDVNGGWVSLETWMTTIVPAIAASVPRANGKWWSTHRWEFQQVRSAVPA